MAYQLVKKPREIPAGSYEKMDVQAPNTQAAGGAYGLEQPGLGDALDAQMQARMARFLSRQNPAAEAEADAVAEGITGRTPAEVKAQLGEKMGADFSDVRFHTGADAVGKAESMGARAYATGRDVYFGEGGFDPAVAAHELVHTAQQGAVESGMSTVSAPMGGVQMMPKFLQKAGSLIKRGALGMGAGLASVASKAWNGTKALGRGIASGAKAAWGGIKNLFSSPPQTPVAAPNYQFNPGANSPQETADFANLATQMRTAYTNSQPTGATQMERFNNALIENNRNNARYPAFVSSSDRIRSGGAMQNMQANMTQRLGARYNSDAKKNLFSSMSQMTREERERSRIGKQSAADFLNDSMDEMMIFMDDPEVQRYLLGNAQALRSATQGQGADDFFADDHLLTNTLLNNLNLYLTSPTLGKNALQMANQSGLGPAASSAIVRTSQGATAMFNKMNTAHTQGGAADLTEKQLAGMAKAIGKEDAGHTYSKEAMLKYHGLYQKMRALIGQ